MREIQKYLQVLRLDTYVLQTWFKCHFLTFAASLKFSCFMEFGIFSLWRQEIFCVRLLTIHYGFAHWKYRKMSFVWAELHIVTSLFCLHSNTLFTIYDVEDAQLLYSLKTVVLCIKCQVWMPCIGHYFVTLTIVLKFGGFFWLFIWPHRYFEHQLFQIQKLWLLFILLWIRRFLEDCKFLVVLRLWQFDMSKYL